MFTRLFAAVGFIFAVLGFAYAIWAFFQTGSFSTERALYLMAMTMTFGMANTCYPQLRQ
jgi:hypothetical protein